MFSIFSELFRICGGLLADFFKLLGLLLFPLVVAFVLLAASDFLRGRRVPKRKVKRTSTRYTKPLFFLLRFYFSFPRRLLDDVLNKNPDFFDTYGVHIFAGEQGSGKSIAAVHFMKMIKERNPGCRIASNISLNFQDAKLNSWEDILTLNNGVYGQVIFLDEIQNWFSSNESRNFPPEMLQEITQQRKQRKIVVGTSQVFTRLAKPIREQITLLYLPFTIAGCLTFVRCYRLKLKEDGTIDKKRLMKLYFFVHDDELRNAYDTFEKVQRLSLVGFKDPSNDISRMSAPSVSVSGFAPQRQDKKTG